MKFLQILVLILGLAALVNAQKAILTGTVYDANGAVIIKAKVTAVNQKGEKFEAFTNDEGIYVLTLPYKDYDSTPNFKIAKYDITVDRENFGFEKFVLKDFKFVGKFNVQMNIDFALDVSAMNPEPCGYGGDGCLNTAPIKSTKTKLSDKILQRPLGELPK